MDRLVGELGGDVVKTELSKLQNEREAARSIAAEASASHQDLADKIESSGRLWEELDRRYDAMRQRLDGLTLANYMKHFEAEANAHERAGYWWLGSAVLLFVTAGLGVGGMWVPAVDSKPNGSFSLELLIVRVVALSLLMTGLTVCVRQYSLNRHSYVTNRHRANSLLAFDRMRNLKLSIRERKKRCLIRCFR
jgi:hypothetical protein